MIDNIILGAIFILLCICLVIKAKEIKLDKYTTNFYIDELDKLILYKCVYHIDVAFGKSFSMSKGLSDDISNEEIEKAHLESITDIFSTMSDTMKKYLIKIYGEAWLIDYIRIQTLSIYLNYTNHTLNSLTIEKFK